MNLRYLVKLRSRPCTRNGGAPFQLGVDLSPVAQRELKVGYLSGDFGQTVMLSFMAHALTLHTRGRGISVVCISVEGDRHEGSDWRKVVMDGVEGFLEVGGQTDEQLGKIQECFHRAAAGDVSSHCILRQSRAAECFHRAASRLQEQLLLTS